MWLRSYPGIGSELLRYLVQAVTGLLGKYFGPTLIVSLEILQHAREIAACLWR